MYSTHAIQLIFLWVKSFSRHSFSSVYWKRLLPTNYQNVWVFFFEPKLSPYFILCINIFHFKWNFSFAFLFIWHSAWALGIGISNIRMCAVYTKKNNRKKIILESRTRKASQFFHIGKLLYRMLRLHNLPFTIISSSRPFFQTVVYPVLCSIFRRIVWFVSHRLTAHSSYSCRWAFAYSFFIRSIVYFLYSSFSFCCLNPVSPSKYLEMVLVSEFFSLFFFLFLSISTHLSCRFCSRLAVRFRCCIFHNTRLLHSCRSFFSFSSSPCIFPSLLCHPFKAIMLLSVLQRLPFFQFFFRLFHRP